jgi:hypothetical protein
MAINIKTIGTHSVILERIGLITKEQLIQVYQKLIAMNLEYLIFDDRNMMLPSHETVYNNDVQSLIGKVVQRDGFLKVIVVVPEDSEMRVLMMNRTMEANTRHKLMFAEDLDSAINMWTSLQD